MPDSESVTAVVRGVEALAGGGATVGVLKRVLGPSIDEVAEVLRRVTEFRLRNIGRIADAADRRSKENGTEGDVHPRVAHRLLEEGSYCDDEVMAEYLGGVLAASRTPSGRDDRAVVWSDMVADMSALQVRAHFLVYRELAVLLAGRGDIQLSVDAGRTQATICIPLVAFLALLSQPGDQAFVDIATALANQPEGDVLAHTIPNLVRLGLLGAEFWYGVSEESSPIGKPNFLPALVVQPSFAGIELYGWALGLPGLTPNEFSTKARVLEPTPRLPRIGECYLPRDATRPPPDEGLPVMDDQ